MTFVLGLTGSIGMGKSTVAGYFREAGIPVWDADATVAKLYGPHGGALAAIAKLCPAAVQTGAVDRKVLKTWLSQTDDGFSQLEAAVHPLVAKDKSAFIETHSEADLIVLDIPLLFETGDPSQMDAILVVSTDPTEQKRRVLARPDMDEHQFNTLLSRQMPDAEKRKRADFVIETETFEQTKHAVLDLVDKLRREPESNTKHA